MTKRWSYGAGEWGRNRVRVFERRPGGMLYVEFYERESGRLVKRRYSLGHRDRARAKPQADEVAAATARAELPPADVTLGELFDLYVREVTSTKVSNTARHDRGCVSMFTRLFGAKRKASTLDIRDWQRFIQLRRAGVIGPDPEKRYRPVGARQIEYDLKTLNAMLNWATKARLGGRPLLAHNPVAGFPKPKEASPRRPVFTQAEYEAVLAAASAVDWRLERALVVAHETGHRISAIAKLRWSDIRWERRTALWRKRNDKQGYEHEVPLTDVALTALQAAQTVRPSVGDVWVFPSPKNPERPCSRETLSKWLRRACAHGGVTRRPGQGFHALRRKFATDLRDAPLKVVAELGGGKSARTLLECYQLPDQEALREALEIRPTNRRTSAKGTRLHGTRKA